MSLFGVASKGNCISDLFYGTDYQTHRGPEFGGIAYLSNNGMEISKHIRKISETQFKGKFGEVLGEINSHLGIGVISAKEEQPVTLDGRVGNFAVCIDGFVNNSVELAEELKHKYGATFEEKKQDGKNNTAEVVANLINQGKNIVDGIEHMYDEIDGSVSLVLLTKKEIYAASDRFPLFIGKRDDSWAIASENCAFPNLGFKLYKNLGSREIIKIDDSGLQPATESQASDLKQVCAFLWIYAGYPASRYEDLYAETARYRTGATLARRDFEESGFVADFVGGIPDSGIGHAVGYAMETITIAKEKYQRAIQLFEKDYEKNNLPNIDSLKQNLNQALRIIIPYARPFVKYTPGYGRSYTPTDQSIRDMVAKLKLMPILDLLKADIVLLEDSIVRGTQLRRYLERLSVIAKTEEVPLGDIYVRPACPPLMWPCKYNISTKTKEELAARQAIEEIEGRMLEDKEIGDYLNPDSQKYAQMIGVIKNNLKVASLRYQRLDDMVKAIGLPRKDLCLYCWNGEEAPKV